MVFVVFYRKYHGKRETEDGYHLTLGVLDAYVDYAYIVVISPMHNALCLHVMVYNGIPCLLTCSLSVWYNLGLFKGKVNRYYTGVHAP